MNSRGQKLLDNGAHNASSEYLSSKQFLERPQPTCSIFEKKMTFGRVQKASFYTSVYRFWPICGRLGLKSTASRSIWLFLRQSLAPGSGGKVVATSHFIFRNPPTHSDPQWWCVWYTVCCVFVFLCIIVYCAEKFWDSYTKKVEFGKILALAITKCDLFFAP